MGAWGEGLFADDLACDLRDWFRDLLGDGLTATGAVAKLKVQYADSLDDPDERPVFWLSLAATQWKLGQPDEETRREALRIIESGEDLERWKEDASSVRARRKVLEKLQAELSAPPPPPKKIKKRHVAENDWAVGEVVGVRLHSGQWVLLRTAGHFKDRGGRFPRCELLDWVGDEIPAPEVIQALPPRHTVPPHTSTRMILTEPKKKDLARIHRTGLIGTPSEARDLGFLVAWEQFDETLGLHYQLR